MRKVIIKTCGIVMSFVVVLATVTVPAVIGTTPAIAKTKKAPEKTKILKLKADGKAMTVTIKVKKVKRAKGYQYKCWGKEYLKYKTKSKKRKLVLSMPCSGTLKVKVRAYNGKRYGKWSAVKRIKIVDYYEEQARKAAEAFEREQQRAQEQQESAEYFERSQMFQSRYSYYLNKGYPSDLARSAANSDVYEKYGKYV